MGIGKPYVRRMAESDLSAVAEIEGRVSPRGWNLRQFAESLQTHQCSVLIGAQQIMGYTVIATVLGEAELLNIAIDKPCQGRGFGGFLLRKILADLPAGMDTIHLEVRASNFPAIRLYQQLGFTQVGERRDYYPLARGRESALLMCLDLVRPGAFAQ